MFHLITGGSGSGKSEYAESQVVSMRQELSREGKCPDVIYIATMMPYGEEGRRRIERHRKLRAGKGFLTKECFVNLPATTLEEIPEDAIVILECMSNLVANELYNEDGAKETTVTSVIEGIKLLQKKTAGLVVVTNDVFLEADSYSPEMQEYKKVLGKINLEMAKMADKVTEVVAGMPISYTPKEMEKREGEGTMHLIIGGAYQGKTTYACSLYPDLQLVSGYDCSVEELLEAEGVLHLEGLVRRLSMEEKEVSDILDLLQDKTVIVCDEVGCGLVPIQKEDRVFRETCGRVLEALAKEADSVERLVCGIPMYLK